MFKTWLWYSFILGSVSNVGLACLCSMARQCGIRIFWFIVFGGASVIGPACLHREGLVYMSSIDPGTKIALACLCRVYAAWDR